MTNHKVMPWYRLINILRKHFFLWFSLKRKYFVLYNNWSAFWSRFSFSTKSRHIHGTVLNEVAVSWNIQSRIGLVHAACAVHERDKSDVVSNINNIFMIVILSQFNLEFILFLNLDSFKNTFQSLVEGRTPFDCCSGEIVDSDLPSLHPFIRIFLSRTYILPFVAFAPL